MKLIAQLFDLLGDESGNVPLGNSALQARGVCILRRQSSQKCADKVDIPMRNAHFRISPIELERMTRLTVVRKIDSLVETAVGLQLMAIIAVEFLPIHRWNVGTKVALVIETQR